MYTNSKNFKAAIHYHETYHALPDTIRRAVDNVVTNEANRWYTLTSAFPQNPINVFDLDKTVPSAINSLADIEKLAADLRGNWNLGNTAISNLAEVLQFQGILIVTCEIHPHVALSALNGRLFREKLSDNEVEDSVGTPFIIVDSRLAPESQYYHMAQELGRILLHNRVTAEISQEGVSPQSDRRKSSAQGVIQERRRSMWDGRWDHYFANALLLPKELLRYYFGDLRAAVDHRELDLLHGLFGVEGHYVLWRAKNAFILQEGSQHVYHQSVPMRLSKKVHSEAYDTSLLFQRLVYRGLAESYFDEAKAAALMDLSLDDFLSMH